MVFKRMLGAFGVGAPSVDTVLSTPRAKPGGTLEGEVRLKGGDFDAEIEHGDGEGSGLGEFARVQVSGPFALRKGEDRVIGFTFPVPWETPISEIEGRPLTGMAVGVRTELAIAKAIDKGDLDMVAIEPLPSQLRILESFLRLGFAFRSADLEAGHLYGVRQELPFYQEIEFYPTGHYAGRVREVEVTFVADPAGLQVVLEADKRDGRFSSSDAIGRFHVSHEDALRTDWDGELGRWLDGLSQHGPSQHGFGHHPGGHGHYDDDHHHRGHHGGAGLGMMAGAAAAGVVGGLVAGEVVEEIVEEFTEDEGGEW